MINERNVKIIPQFPMGERNAELFLNFVASLLLHTTDRLVVGGETKVQLIKYKTFLQIPPRRYFIV